MGRTIDLMSSHSVPKTAYLLTGGPGVGKTTILKEVLSRVPRSAGGFYTEEIRTKGVRQGFRIVTLDGNSTILADTGISSACRVGRYRVNVAGIDELAVPALRDAIASRDIVVIDEIGKMELFSRAFKDAVYEALDSGKTILGTIMLGPHGWADRIKQRSDVDLLLVTRLNRRDVAGRVLAWLQT